MSEIKVNLLLLDAAIQRLNSLSGSWASASLTPPLTVGGGKIVNELEELAEMYKSLNDSMVELANNTADFLQNAMNSYIEGDRTAVSGFRGGTQ